MVHIYSDPRPARQEITLISDTLTSRVKSQNHVTANHERGGINKRRGGFNNSLH